MLSGSLALNVYAIPRMTRDIDFVVELQEPDIEKFLKIFQLNFYINPQTVKAEVARNGMFNVIDQETGFKIDFIVRKNTEFRKLEFARRKKIDISGFSAFIVTPEDLIISKLEWIQRLQSGKQIEDIVNLLEYKELDVEYIKNWCNLLHLNTFNLL